MSPPEDATAPDLEQIAALVRDGDQRIAGEIIAMRSRLIEFGDALTEIREKIGMPGAVRAPMAASPSPRVEAPRAEMPDVAPVDVKQIESLRVPLVDLARRLEQAMDSVRDVEAFRIELSKEGEAIGERVGARAERSFRRLEEAFSAMRMQLDSVANQVRARPEAEFAASIRAQMQQAASELQHDVVTLGEDMRAQVTQLAQDLRREVAVEVTKELEELREPVRALREHAAALRQISGLDELAADLALVSRHLEAIDARIGSLGAQAASPVAASAPEAGERIGEMFAHLEARIVATLDARLAGIGAYADPSFLGSFGSGEIEEEERGLRRFFNRRRSRDDDEHGSAASPISASGYAEIGSGENIFFGRESAVLEPSEAPIDDASRVDPANVDDREIDVDASAKPRVAKPKMSVRAKALPRPRAPRASRKK